MKNTDKQTIIRQIAVASINVEENKKESAACVLHQYADTSFDCTEKGYMEERCGEEAWRTDTD